MLTGKPLTTALRKIAFYEWAYGILAEADSDIGPLGEYLVGKALDCLPPGRKDNATYDLVMKGGTTIEVKATSRIYTPKRGTPYWRWKVEDQKRALTTGVNVADWWFFLKAQFPEGAAAKRTFNAFDPQWWTVYAVRGADLLATGVKTGVTESTLARAHARTCTFKELPRVVHEG